MAYVIKGCNFFFFFFKCIHKVGKLTAKPPSRTLAAPWEWNTGTLSAKSSSCHLNQEIGANKRQPLEGHTGPASKGDSQNAHSAHPARRALQGRPRKVSPGGPPTGAPKGNAQFGTPTYSPPLQVSSAGPTTQGRPRGAPHRSP